MWGFESLGAVLLMYVLIIAAIAGAIGLVIGMLLG